MDYETIYLRSGEKKRFLEIAKGDDVASNTPDEDALFRYGLVQETILVKFDPVTKETVNIDLRAVVLTEDGKNFYAQYQNRKREKIKSGIICAIEIAIGIIGILITFDPIRALLG